MFRYWSTLLACVSTGIPCWCLPIYMVILSRALPCVEAAITLALNTLVIHVNRRRVVSLGKIKSSFHPGL